MTQAVQVPVTSVALSGSDVGPWSTVWTAGAPADVSVWLKAPGVAAVLVDDADVTVTGAEPLVSGYEVEISASLVGGDEWANGSFAYLVRTTPTGQTASIGASNAVPLAVIEAALDRLSRQTQDQGVEVARGIKVPLGESLDDLPDAATRAGSVLAFDSEGQPDPSKTYAQLVVDIAGAIEPDVLEAVAAAGAEQVLAVEAEGQQQIAGILAASDTGLDEIAQAVSDGSTALGLPTGGIIERIPASEGFFGGHAFTDVNGWTTPDFYYHPGDVVGDVYVFKTLPGDLSGEVGAVRIYVAPAIMEADYTIVFWAGQSDATGATAVPMPSRTPSDFAAMLDTPKPATWVGSFGSTLTQAVNWEHIYGTNHDGTTFTTAAADKLEQLIEDIDGEVFADHGKKVIFVQVGLGASDVPSFSYPSAHFTRVIDWATAVKAACVTAGKTVKVGAIVWAGWGAYAYANGYNQATVESRIDSYCGASGSIATYILPIFGQTGEVIPVGICGDNHHFQGSDPITPQVALAEQALIAAQPARYSYVLNKGPYHLNGRNRGWGASSSHQHADEEEAMAGVVALWLHSKLTRDGEAWPNFVPTAASFARTGADEMTLTMPDWPSGVSWGFEPTGLFPTGARAQHGWFFCAPGTPTTEIGLARLPYPGASPGTLIFKGVSNFPTPCEVRFGCRTSSDSIAGNTVIKPDTPITVPVRGVATPIFHTLPTLKLQVA